MSTITENTSPASFGAALAQLRHDAGFSQSTLARLANVSHSTLSRWERGTNLPSLPELDSVFTALRTDERQRATLVKLMPAPRGLRRLRETQGGFPPDGGDLLWAMRQRKGWTQSQLAHCVGVSQSQIARWEKSEVWPDVSRLHTLCFHLNAEPEEIAALTVGDKQLDLSLTPPGLWQSAFDGEAWHIYLERLVHSSTPLLPLALLTAERDIREISTREPRAEVLLANVYAAQARYHLYWQRNRDAADWGARSVAIVRRHGVKNMVRSTWFSSIIALATYAAQGERAAGLRRAVALFEHALPDIAHDPTYHAWGMALQADYLAALGGEEAAAALGQAACDRTRGEFPGEYFFRVLDNAQLLLRMKRPVDAWSTLKSLALIKSSTFAVSPHAAVRRQLLEAESLLGLKAFGDADARLRAAETQVRRLHMPDLSDRWQRLASRC